MLVCICSVTDHSRRQNVVRTSVTQSAIASCATISPCKRLESHGNNSILIFSWTLFWGFNLANKNTGYPLSNSLVMFMTGTTVPYPQEDLEVWYLGINLLGVDIFISF